MEEAVVPLVARAKVLAPQLRDRVARFERVRGQRGCAGQQLAAARCLPPFSISKQAFSVNFSFPCLLQLRDECTAFAERGAAADAAGGGISTGMGGR